ncbi:hypothetical protein L484_008094 [Morus notabilis]|uniref:Uncharacterized protein n=1 Tax=Morus notabilis TaxID=981085 RepID=W9RDK8_9ROSA|nr:hypothetical protein L484_008094 [Morus notabilis]
MRVGSRDRFKEPDIVPTRPNLSAQGNPKSNVYYGQHNNVSKNRSLKGSLVNGAEVGSSTGNERTIFELNRGNGGRRNKECREWFLGGLN